MLKVFLFHSVHETKVRFNSPRNFKGFETSTKKPQPYERRFRYVCWPVLNLIPTESESRYETKYIRIRAAIFIENTVDNNETALQHTYFNAMHEVVGTYVETQQFITIKTVTTLLCLRFLLRPVWLFVDFSARLAYNTIFDQRKQDVGKRTI